MIHLPDGCQCKPSEWYVPLGVYPICREFETDNDLDECIHCWHRKACHEREEENG